MAEPDHARLLAAPGAGGRRARQQVRRTRRIEFTLSQEEYGLVLAAAARSGLAAGAFAARETLTAASGASSMAGSPLLEMLGELMRAAGLVRRAGVNLNQAVAKLNATGQPPGDLLPYAEQSLRYAERLDEVAEQVRRQLR